MDHQLIQYYYKNSFEPTLMWMSLLTLIILTAQKVKKNSCNLPFEKNVFNGLIKFYKQRKELSLISGILCRRRYKKS